MNTNQNHLFRKQSDSESNQAFVEKQIDVAQEEPNNPTPDEPTIPEPPDEDPERNSPEPGIDEPSKNDPTRIDEEPPIFDNY